MRQTIARFLSKIRFLLSLALVSVDCNELAHPLPQLALRYRVQGCKVGGESMKTCVNLSDSRIKPMLLR